MSFFIKYDKTKVTNICAHKHKDLSHKIQKWSNWKLENVNELSKRTERNSSAVSPISTKMNDVSKLTVLLSLNIKLIIAHAKMETCCRYTPSKNSLIWFLSATGMNLSDIHHEMSVMLGDASLHDAYCPQQAPGFFIAGTQTLVHRWCKMQGDHIDKQLRYFSCTK